MKGVSDIERQKWIDVAISLLTFDDARQCMNFDAVVKELQKRGLSFRRAFKYTSRAIKHVQLDSR